jgi:predicted AAA+ superfamily ATPase
VLNELFELSRHLIRILDRPYRRRFLEAPAWQSRCALILGQRGVGKTTCLVQHLVRRHPAYASARECLYLPVDHFVVAQTPLYEIARDFAQQGGKLLCLDEIHKQPDWARNLKSIHDTFPDLRVLASGSSMLQLHRGSHDLSRRAIVGRLSGLSFREYLELRLDLTLPVLTLERVLREHETLALAMVQQLAAKDAKVLGLFHDYLQVGFYPYCGEYADRNLFRLTLEQNVHTAIESDLTALHPHLSGSSVARIKRLLAVIAAAVPFTPDLAKLRRLLEIADDRTLKIYLQRLEEAGLIMTIGRAAGGLRAMAKPEKIFLGDPNQIHALCTPGQASSGNVRETFFCRMLREVGPIHAAERGDFVVGPGVVIEVGGRSKSARQIRGQAAAFLALDDIETGAGCRIPLWLFGCLY